MILSPLYIDPGTGSMLFSIFIGLAVAATFGIRALFIKIKFFISGGKVEKSLNDKSIPFVIFSDHKRYWNVFKPICDEFERRKTPIVFYTASEDDPALVENYEYVKTEYIGSGNKPYVKLNFLNADILIATTPNLDVYQWKRSKNVKCYVHIPHSADELAGYRMFGLDYYDVVLTSGEAQNTFIRTIENLRPTINKKELITVGSLPLDMLKAKLDIVGNRNKNTKPVVLLAPSWGKSAILSRYGEPLLEALSKSNFEVIVRPHPQTVVSEQNVLKPLTEKFSKLEWNYDNDNFEVLNKADILITDFSGIIFDFAIVFNKPFIYSISDFDTGPYDADWLDEPKWSIQILPQLGVELKKEMLSDIETIINDTLENPKFETGRKEIRNQAWANIGKSAEASVDWLIEKQKNL